MWSSIATMLPLVLVIAISVFFTFLLSRRLLRRQSATANAESLITRPEAPLFFDTPRGWLAVKTDDVQSVQAALRLHHALPCSWSEGLERAAEAKIFITPPVSGWVLVFGASLPEPSDDIDDFHAFILELSRQLGLVIYFNAQPVFYHHAWIKVLDGRVVRAYAWADETLWNQGDLTQAEHDLHLRCRPYGDPPSEMVPRTREIARRNCERVSQLAARWSIDPKSLDVNFLSHETGIAGEFIYSRPH